MLSLAPLLLVGAFAGFLGLQLLSRRDPSPLIPDAERAEDSIPDEVLDAMSPMAGLGAAANVIMQLSILPVGHGVAKSRVESGRVDKHPIKRARTTLTYLVVAMLGTTEERKAMRDAVNGAHRQVYSLPDDPVTYNAFDRDLQLWVAACLYRGIEDVYAVARREPLEGWDAKVVYRHGARLATTLQVRPEQWPEDRAAFERYWQDQVARIEMDDVTRPYLQGVARLEFMGWLISRTLGPLNALYTVGFLPPAFRDELGLPWTPRHQRWFDRLTWLHSVIERATPRPLRLVGMYVYLWDFRIRRKLGWKIV